jgi:predicted Kef-type K+ transport protein
MLGFDTQTSFIVGLALAFSSTIIILKLLSDKKEQSRLYGKIAIGILLVQDIVATLALLYLSAQGNGEGISASQFGELALKGVLLVSFLAFFSMKVFPHINKLIAGSQEFLFLFALGWGLGVASAFEVAGFSIEVGALFAGIALAPLP